MRRVFALVVVVACQPSAAPSVVLVAPSASASAVPNVAMVNPEPAVPLRVLFRGDQPAWSHTSLGNGKSWTRALTWLLGVDATHTHAYVTHQAMNGSDEFEIDTIDLVAKTETRWIATKRDARSRSFHPLTGSAEEDLAKLGNIVDATGPFVVRSRDYAGAHLAVSHDHIAYEADHDALMIARRDGTQPVRLDGGASAAYYPTFSADGSHVAFTACNYRTVPPGAFYQCLYRVYVAPIGGRPTGYAITQPQPPTFSADGKWVYAASRDIDHDAEPHDRGGCAEGVELATGSVSKLSCGPELHDVELETGATKAVFHGWRGTIGEQVREFRWLDLPSGKLLATIPVDRGTSNASYGGGDYVVTSSQHGLVAVNMRSMRQEVIPEPRESSTWLSNQWRDAHTIYALRTIYGERAYEVVAIDARAALHET